MIFKSLNISLRPLCLFSFILGSSFGLGEQTNKSPYLARQIWTPNLIDCFVIGLWVVVVVVVVLNRDGRPFRPG